MPSLWGKQGLFHPGRTGHLSGGAQGPKPRPSPLPPPPCVFSAANSKNQHWRAGWERDILGEIGELPEALGAVCRPCQQSQRKRTLHFPFPSCEFLALSPLGAGWTWWPWPWPQRTGHGTHFLVWCGRLPGGCSEKQTKHRELRGGEGRVHLEKGHPVVTPTKTSRG